MSKTVRFLFVFLSILPVIGCAKSFSKVEGTVTLDGQPVVGATVTLMPTFEGGQSGSGITDSSGKFKIANPTNDKGVVKGEYKVLITRADPDTGINLAADSDPTTAMAELMKGKMDVKAGKMKGAMNAPLIKEKQTLNARYAKQDTTPFTIKVPLDGALTLQLEK